MKDFLAYVAEDIILKYGTDLSHIAIVFPNKRASMFLNEHLARLAGKPLWSPAYVTISDLFRQQSQRLVADPIKLICDLHRSFCKKTGIDESLDKFFGWGQLMLADFDDIDKNMADADRVFANIRDIHELDDISYLTDEQREMIRRFFSNFTETHNSELKERFLRLWSHFADIYHDFNDRLAEQGLAYEGALYRQVASSACCCATETNTTPTDTTTTATAFPYDCYLFVGFNLIQKVEQQLFRHLKQAGKARFYWDFDQYYLEHNEAGQFISRYLELFPNELDNRSDEIYNNFVRPKHISYIAATTENIQARYVSKWLREVKERESASPHHDARRTAIVLCNEKLLPVVIHCLPPEVEKVNVTTGYPLSQTPVAAFMQLYFNLLLGGRSPRLKRLFMRHPYAKYLESEDALLSQLDSPLPTLLQMLRTIATHGKDDFQDPLVQESLFRAYTLVNRLDDLVGSGDLAVDDHTLQRLVTQLIRQTTIPFHGEPAEGIQVMGVLETRNLDFDHVLLLSCNEGNLPRGVNDSSFIPHSIRHAYELTTIENKVSIYAYYYHRLLQRAQDVTILYNSATEDGQRGEMSRFMLQMLVESPHSIGLHTLQSDHTVLPGKPAPIAKTRQVMQVLLDPYTSSEPKTLSPTAINRYMRCPLQFYYRYVADLKEPDVPDDEQELDNRIFGNIFHDAADIIYKQLPQQITREVLDHLLRSKVEIERAVDTAFAIHYSPKAHRPSSDIGGLHLINREVIIHYLRQLIQIDRRQAPFTILGLECDVKHQYSFPYALQHHTLNERTPHSLEGNSQLPIYIGGRIDRLDQLSDGTIRVVDYKTGGHRLKPLADIDAIFLPENIHEHSDYYLQTFIYADIVSRQHSSKFKVSPALLFIQHAGADDYDPVLCFGKERITDIAPYSAHFNELLEQKVAEIFSPETPFTPTGDTKICRTCPYAQLCRQA